MLLFMSMIYSLLTIQREQQEYFNALKVYHEEEAERIREDLEVSFEDLGQDILLNVKSRAPIPVELSYVVINYGGLNVTVIKLTNNTLGPGLNTTLGPYPKLRADSQLSVKVITSRGNVFEAYQTLLERRTVGTSVGSPPTYPFTGFRQSSSGAVRCADVDDTGRFIAFADETTLHLLRRDGEAVFSYEIEDGYIARRVEVVDENNVVLLTIKGDEHAKIYWVREGETYWSSILPLPASGSFLSIEKGDRVTIYYLTCNGELYVFNEDGTSQAITLGFNGEVFASTDNDLTAIVYVSTSGSGHLMLLKEGSVLRAVDIAWLSGICAVDLDVEYGRVVVGSSLIGIYDLNLRELKTIELPSNSYVFWLKCEGNRIAASVIYIDAYYYVSYYYTRCMVYDYEGNLIWDTSPRYEGNSWYYSIYSFIPLYPVKVDVKGRVYAIWPSGKLGETNILPIYQPDGTLYTRVESEYGMVHVFDVNEHGSLLVLGTDEGLLYTGIGENSPGFEVTLSQEQITVARDGFPKELTVEVAPYEGYSSNIELEVLSLPQGINVALESSTGSPPFTSRIFIQANATANTGQSFILPIVAVGEDGTRDAAYLILNVGEVTIVKRSEGLLLHYTFNTEWRWLSTGEGFEASFEPSLRRYTISFDSDEPVSGWGGIYEGVYVPEDYPAPIRIRVKLSDTQALDPTKVGRLTKRIQVYSQSLGWRTVYEEDVAEDDTEPVLIDVEATPCFAKGETNFIFLQLFSSGSAPLRASVCFMYDPYNSSLTIYGEDVILVKGLKANLKVEVYNESWYLLANAVCPPDSDEAFVTLNGLGPSSFQGYIVVKDGDNVLCQTGLVWISGGDVYQVNL